MDVFTSITLNYLPKARILAKSLKSIHSDWKLHLVVCEKSNTTRLRKEALDFDKNLFDNVVWLEELDIPNINSWAFKHTVVELCTAVKGFYLKHLVNQGHEKIFYIDPDIVIFNELTPLEELLDDNGILLIPHLVDFTDDSHSILVNEIDGALRHGTFNFGFLGVNSKIYDGARFADWWWNRLYDYCYADFEKGLFTDQKWGDLIPSFFSDYHVVRDPGYDVASWNLDCRHISINMEGQLLINQNYPLRFYHFTGYDSGAGIGVIKYLTAKSNNNIVLELWNWYHHQLTLNGHNELGNEICSFEYFENGVKITKEMRTLYKNNPELQNRFLNPYEVKNKDNYYEWWLKEKHK